jgi:hypothetical protein
VNEDFEIEEADEEPVVNPNKKKRLIGELKRLATSYNQDATQQLESLSSAIEKDLEYQEFGFVGAVTGDYNEPAHFDEAWNAKSSEDKKGWREAVRKEFGDMQERGVWQIVKKKEIPRERRLIGSKWVFKKKRTGVYRARLVALGYSQIPGVDFTENFAPVVNDVTFRIILTMIIVLKLQAVSLDVETAFLHGALDEEIYMKCPRGMSNTSAYSFEKVNNEEDCLRLTKSIYGLVQAARQWWKRFTSEVKKFGFVTNEIDPCLLYRQDEDGICIIALYVDDSILAGHQRAIDRAVKQIGEVFAIKVQGSLDDYLGCDIHFNADRTAVWLGQPSIIEGIQKRFGEVLPLKTLRTPSTPGWVAVRPLEDDLRIDEERQRDFRGGVGMLLHLVKHSRPDIANATRELSKVMDGATEGQ